MAGKGCPRFLSMDPSKFRRRYLTLVILAWVFTTHFIGIYLFMNGFLLARAPLPNHSSYEHESPGCGVTPTHKRLVFIVIDALRFDLISPDPPSPASPYYHNIVTLPRELTASSPDRSFLFDSYADPPTTSSQRVKGMMTGSFPSYVEFLSCFRGLPVHEDSFIHQLVDAGKKVWINQQPYPVPAR